MQKSRSNDDRHPLFAAGQGCWKSRAHRLRLGCTLLLFCGLAIPEMLTAGGQDAVPGANLQPAVAVEAELGKHIGYLASDELRGRDVGSEGLELAAQYIAASFEQTGLETKLFDDTPFQTFNVRLGVTVGDPVNNQLAITRPRDGAEPETTT